MRVLVTGHRGFIGTHLTRELEANGHEVIGHDREEGDLTQPGVLAARLDNWKPDRVVHLAAQVGRLFGEDDLIHTVNANATMTTLVAHACGERDIPVLYASTSEVYGDQGTSVCDEDVLFGLPHNLYGLTKRWGEEVLEMYAPDGLQIVRLSMPYGPGAPPGRGRRALDNFLWQAHHRMPIPVHQGAERTWCHVTDTVRGIRMVLEHGDYGNWFGIYNVGRDDHPVSMLSLAKRACEMTDANPLLIRLTPPPARQTLVKRLSTDRLRSLGWKPTIELDEGLPELLEWVKGFDRDGNPCVSV
ncbi:MAG: NAD(P)-dependent oxidoreductase [Marmoricola sp.]